MAGSRCRALQSNQTDLDQLMRTINPIWPFLLNFEHTCTTKKLWNQSKIVINFLDEQRVIINQCKCGGVWPHSSRWLWSGWHGGWYVPSFDIYALFCSLEASTVHALLLLVEIRDIYGCLCHAFERRLWCLNAFIRRLWEYIQSVPDSWVGIRWIFAQVGARTLNKIYISCRLIRISWENIFLIVAHNVFGHWSSMDGKIWSNLFSIDSKQSENKLI
jgi:hypothetical protein